MQSTTIVAPKVTRAQGVSLAAIGAYSPASSAIVSSLVLANITGSPITVTCTLFDGTNDTRLVLNAPVAVGDSLMVGGADAKFTLVAGWSIRAAASVASGIDASMCVTEFA